MNTVIIEDSLLVLDSLKRMLSGLKAYHFAGGAGREEEAVALIDEKKPDLVLLDLALASGSGLNVLKRIRAQGCGARVLVLTNNADDAYRETCMAAGADGFYDKGRETADLLRRLVQWLPPAPANEVRRLRALRGLNILDTPAEEVFDEVTRLCADMLDMPMAMVSLVDDQRQWFKSRVGLPDQESARSVAFCAHAINSPEPLVVEDATQDPRFADNPLVRGPAHLRFYAGVPLTLAGGEAVGTLGVIDRQPRRLSPRQGALLEVLARKVVGELELRQRLATLESEVQQRREMEVRIMHLATRDPLTGLPNRAALMDRLSQGIKLAERDRHLLAFLFLDLDRFKLINDTLGHPVGDGLLQQVGERITHVLRDSDTVARIGGDEFAVVLPHIDSVEDAHRVAEKLLEALRRPMEIQGHTLRAECSIGLAVYPDHGENDELLIRHADMALYEAKRAGTHEWRLYEPVMNEMAVQRFTLESELRAALGQGDMTLYYQPQISLEDGRVTGLEALVRWQHPTRGLVAPAHFIPLAEETGLIWDLGLFVLDAASRQVAAWRSRGLRVPRLAINVSPAQLRPELAQVLASCLEKHHCPGKCLEVEITESALTADGPQVLELLDELHRLGISIAVDDFGVGYSSLALLRRLPLDALKVDKSFVDELVSNRQDASIVDAILRMSRGMGLRTVAEGVETDAQREALGAMGCQNGQGYLFSRPLPADELEAWLREWESWHPRQPRQMPPG